MQVVVDIHLEVSRCDSQHHRSRMTEACSDAQQHSSISDATATILTIGQTQLVAVASLQVSNVTFALQHRRFSGASHVDPSRAIDGRTATHSLQSRLFV